MIQQIASAIPTSHFYLVELANGTRYRHRVASRLESLHLVLEQIEKSGILEIELNNIYTLPGADKLIGKEAALCKDFIASMEKQLEFDKKFSRVKDTELSR